MLLFFWGVSGWVAGRGDPEEEEEEEGQEAYALCNDSLQPACQGLYRAEMTWGVR